MKNFSFPAAIILGLVLAVAGALMLLGGYHRFALFIMWLSLPVMLSPVFLITYFESRASEEPGILVRALTTLLERPRSPRWSTIERRWNARQRPTQSHPELPHN